MCLCAAAHAQTPPLSASARHNLCLQDDVCRQHSASARELSRAGNLRAAIDEYEAAYHEIQLSVFLYNIARLYHRLGNLRQAASYYSRYLSTAIDEDPEQRARARSYLDEVQKSPALAAPEPPVPSALSPLQASPPAPAPIEPPRKVPVYKKWWFWTIIGTVAAGTAIGVGVGLGTNAAAQAPTDIMLYQPSF